MKKMVVGDSCTLGRFTRLYDAHLTVVRNGVATTEFPDETDETPGILAGPKSWNSDDGRVVALLPAG